ncbi:MAG: glycosyltransferase [Gammaproteobacteria bacterium]|nr:glycosyltransferase [Gammaproteobacteria bacterium]MDH5691606.1 glycosyltransferase [Gammaproteobacteria bacterium]
MTDVSVVLSVFNGGDDLKISLDSLLAQEGVDFEIIVVNDGSVDETAKLLDEYSRQYSCVKIIHQENLGLTRSLIKGCSKAQGRYIARQDCGDRSLPGRLLRQFKIMEQNPGLVMIACGTRYLDEKGNCLYTVSQTDEQLVAGLNETDEKSFKGPSSHGSTMFRKDIYDLAGGYRLPFYVAQDLDLWTRLIEHGSCASIPDVLFETQWSLGSISHMKRKQQVIALRAIIECKARRLAGKSEEEILVPLDKLLRNNGWDFVPSRLQASRYHYFLACTLAGRDTKAAKEHFDSAIKSWPLNLKAWWRRVMLSTQ